MKINLKLFSILIVYTSLWTQTNAFYSNKDLYLDLIKKCLINSIYRDPSHYYTGTTTAYNQFDRENGKDWPLVAHTMVGLKRLNNIQFCVEEILKNNIPGDLIEAGVWRGGSVIFMRALLKAYNCTDRAVWAADSFEGLPVPNIATYPADKGWDLYKFNNDLAISLETVQENFRRYDLLDNQVRFLKGWFHDTLPNAPIEKIAILRLDGDLYESTMDTLKNLYPKLSIGGFVIIDDYSINACVKAVEDFRAQNNINDEIKKIDWTGVFWQRSK